MTGWVRRASTTRLLIVSAAVVLGAAGAAAVASAMGGGASAPPRTDLHSLVGTQLAGQPPEGISARITFKNNLLGAGALGQDAGASALAAGADGRFWWSGDRVRLELQSGQGDVQLVAADGKVTVYDSGRSAAYQLSLPARPAGEGNGSGSGGMPNLFEGDVIGQLSQVLSFGEPQPGVVGGRPAYTIRVAPRDQSSLLDAVLVSLDAEHPVPLALQVMAEGRKAPVLSLELSDVKYGSVDASVFDLNLPDGVKVEQLSPPSPDSLGGGDGAAPSVDFPKSIGGLPLTQSKGSFAVYGQGLGSVVVVAKAAEGDSGARKVVETPLGTLVTVRKGDVVYTVAGSVPRAVAEAAAADL
ncbi:MAG: hypothetical protein QOJ13_3667 [Gaiellales bacterium]|nr:hypothetical protein [Gaiellales bacterium]